jgi:hypothetical protein
MQKRAARFSLLALLLLSGFAAAFFTWNTERRLHALERDRLARESALERLTPAITAIAAVQQAYIEYGQKDEASFVRVSTLLDQITTDAAGLRSTEPPAEGAASLEEFWAALSALLAADKQARQTLAAGESLIAADLLFGTSRAHVTTVDATLHAFREAEFEEYQIRRAALVQRSWMTLGGVALLWVFGLLTLVRVPASAVQPVPAPPATIAAPAPAPPDTIAAPAPAPEKATAPSPIDLRATSDLCAAISRLDDTLSLPQLLGRAAGILDARGIIIWMAAGDELFAAAAHGYDSSLLRRLRPMARAAENATAAAWRTGEIHTVDADATSHGAIVAPMFGPQGGIGVLAAEVRNGRETDADTRAVTAIIASQFAAVLTAWPAASAAAAGEGAAEAVAATPPESDRKAAAS